MRWQAQPALPTVIHPFSPGRSSSTGRGWVVGMVTLAVFAVIAVVLDIPSPARPLAVLLFLALGPGLAVVGLFGITDLTQRMVLATGVSLALDTIIAGLSIYSGYWNPTAVLLILACVTLSGAALQVGTGIRPTHTAAGAPIPVPPITERQGEVPFVLPGVPGQSAMVGAGVTPTTVIKRGVSTSGTSTHTAEPANRVSGSARLIRSLILLGCLGSGIMALALRARRLER